MGDVVIVEAAQNMKNGVCLSDICQELVPQTLSFACSFHQTRDIYYFHGCRNGALRMTHFGKDIKSLVRHVRRARLRIYGAEREVGALGLA